MSESVQSIERLQVLRTDIEKWLQAYVVALPTTLGVGVSQNGELALERLKDFALRPGKRIRGALAIIGYEMFGGTHRRTGLDLAVAVELAQDYLLIIDDVMDRSAQRRGGDAVHYEYQRMLQRDYGTRDYAHLGNMLGVNVGLIAQHLSARLVGDIAEPPERIVRALHIFQTNITATGFGQLDDLMNEAGQALDLEGTRHMYMLKSSYYTFINPLQLGAVLAGAADTQLGPIERFGQAAGMAFQLQDDIIGMFGDTRTTGKSALDDLREGKMTLLMRHALARTDDVQRAVIEAALGNADVTPTQHREVQEILDALGSRAYISQEARKAADAAREILVTQTAWSPEAKTFLQDLLTYIIRRER